jgi:hypothetical protein
MRNDNTHTTGHDPGNDPPPPRPLPPTRAQIEAEIVELERRVIKGKERIRRELDQIVDLVHRRIQRAS